MMSVVTTGLLDQWCAEELGRESVRLMTTVTRPQRALDGTKALTACIVVVLVLSPALAKLAFYPAYPGSDDAFIHIATAKHVLNGEGWGVVSADRVNLSSSPMFVLLLLPVFAIGSIGLAQIVSVAFACAALAITFFATRLLTASTMCGLVALVVAAANVHLWRWSGTVMETSLGYLAVTAIAAVTAWLMMRAPHASLKHCALLGALIGFGTLVRFEIGMLLPLSLLLLWFSWGTGRFSRGTGRRLAVVSVGFAAVVLPWMVFAKMYFGTLLPTTFSAKADSLHIINLTAVKNYGTVAVSGFGLSILIAAVAIALAHRSVEGRARLREYAAPLCFLVLWPIVLFAFYYIKLDEGFGGVARWFLPGMATWPIAAGLLVATVPPKPQYRYWLTAALVGCLVVAVVFNVIRVRPVLNSFNSGYRQAMTHGAAYLRDHCKPGDIALIWSDIGVMADEGIGACALVDGGTLATPQLHGMSDAEMFSYVRPTYVVQSIGSTPNELAAEYPQLALQMSESYTDHGVGRAGILDYLNIYRVKAG
jgi:hypothetical protein